MTQYLLAIDQGTTSTRACIYDEQQQLIATAQQSFNQSFPDLAWVEHDADEIWQSVLTVCRQALATAQLNACDIAGLGISNQRETTVLWHKITGDVIAPAIVWQDRRTLAYCETLKAQGLENFIQTKTGLVIDPYFSASKIRWLLDHHPVAKALADQGLLAFGTIESFLVWRLTGGATHITDVTNASRTLLMNIQTRQWDDELLAVFNIPRSVLPTIVSNTGHFGETVPALFGTAIAITGMAGDQQAAMIGEACIKPDTLKATLGTGAFLMLNTGHRLIQSQCRLLTTIAYQVGDDFAYALEGSVFNCGVAIQWLRDQLGLIQSAQETEALARSLSSNEGFYLVPAFTGLGAPYWRSDVRALCCGITRATTKAHFARGALEAVAYLLLAIKTAMEQEAALTISEIRVDGGLTANAWLLQFLTDMLQVPLRKSASAEASCRGAALLAGIGAGLYENLAAATAGWQQALCVTPSMDAVTREQNIHGWQQALAKCIDA